MRIWWAETVASMKVLSHWHLRWREENAILIKVEITLTQTPRRVIQRGNMLLWGHFTDALLAERYVERLPRSLNCAIYLGVGAVPLTPLQIARKKWGCTIPRSAQSNTHFLGHLWPVTYTPRCKPASLELLHRLSVGEQPLWEGPSAHQETLVQHTPLRILVQSIACDLL